MEVEHMNNSKMARNRYRFSKRRNAGGSSRVNNDNFEEEMLANVDSRAVINSLKCAHEKKRKQALEGKLPIMIAKTQQLNEKLLQRIKELRFQRDTKKASVQLNTKVNLSTESDTANEVKRIHMRILECSIGMKIKALDEEYLNAAVHAELRVRRELDRSSRPKPVPLDYAERPNGPHVMDKRKKPLVIDGPVVVNQLPDERIAYIAEMIRGALLRKDLEEDLKEVFSSASSDSE
ncbi:putative bifunctional phosphatase/peptidyl-prolyl cis-trans isomerase [Trichinella spiralis]|uniref:Bifunctional phosphatase/peptidyl-prolyl cis-trans isomerase n=1 Tax=Trichinella spiralis TaxID=6334 RepID=A0ABR3KQC2_TRISP